MIMIHTHCMAACMTMSYITGVRTRGAGGASAPQVQNKGGLSPPCESAIMHVYIISEVCTLESLSVKLAPTKCCTKEVSKNHSICEPMSSECTRIDLRRYKIQIFLGEHAPQTPLDHGGHSPPWLLTNQMKSQPPYSKISSYTTVYTCMQWLACHYAITSNIKFTVDRIIHGQ
jgi:hypothetical protein